MLDRTLATVHRLTDPSPRVWQGKRNARVKDTSDLEALCELIETFEPCSIAERDAAADLLANGLEARPLNAIERAHSVLVTVGIVDDEARWPSGRKVPRD